MLFFSIIRARGVECFCTFSVSILVGKTKVKRTLGASGVDVTVKPC